MISAPAMSNFESASTGEHRTQPRSDTANVFGDAFMDSHLAFAPTGDGSYGEPASRMTFERAKQVVPYLNGCEFVAVKTNWPATQADPLERAASVLSNFRTMLGVLQ